MKKAYLVGIKSAPSWLVIMEAAQRWAIPPWKIIKSPKTLWYARFEVVREMEIKRDNRQRKEIEQARKRRK